MRKLIFGLMILMLIPAIGQAWRGEKGLWGKIVGTIAEQTDIITEIADSSHAAETRAKDAAGDSARTVVGDSLAAVQDAIDAAEARANAQATELDSLRAITTADSIAAAEARAYAQSTELDSLRALTTADSIAAAEARANAQSTELDSLRAITTADSIAAAEARANAQSTELDSLRAITTADSIAAAEARANAQSTELDSLRAITTADSIAAAEARANAQSTELDSLRALTTADSIAAAEARANAQSTELDSLRAITTADSIAAAEARANAQSTELDSLRAITTADSIAAAEARAYAQSTELDSLRALTTADSIAAAEARANAQSTELDSLRAITTADSIAAAEARANAQSTELDSLRALTTADSIAAAEARAKTAAMDSALVAVSEIDSSQVTDGNLSISDVQNLEARLVAAIGMLAAAFPDSFGNRHLKAWADSLILGLNSDFKMWRKSLDRVATSAGDTIEVQGPLWLNPNTASSGILWGANGFQYGKIVNNTGTGNYEWWGTGGGTDWIFATDGGVPKVTITETGRITAVDSMFAAGYGTASDRRLKADIENLPYGLKEIMKLIPRKYTMKGFPGIGFIAQEVEPIIPEAVGKGQDGYLNLSYDTVIPVLVKAVQEQQREIQMLKFMLLVAVFLSVIALARTWKRRDR